MKLLFHFCLPLIASMASLWAAQYTVSSADDFNNLTLLPGDEVIWSNGTYGDDDNINFAANGTATNPITLRAETPGGVMFNGGMTMTIPGDYVIVEGLYWNGGEGQNNYIQFRKNTDYANYSTIRNCAINSLAEDGTDKHRWIVLYGTNNTVENCSFTNKRSPGALILAELEYNETFPIGHTIRNNYFYNYTYRDPESTNSNDAETIRIGESSHQAKDARAIVENNYFRACDGENEIITNKSTNNTYRYNTFRNCHGSLVLRHGANAWVEGNFFLGENKPHSGGIRVTDSFHTIINNYFQDLNNDGDIWNNAITLVGGSASTGGSSSGYQKVDDILIAYNTVYNCDDPLFFNDRESYDPTGTFAYNLLHSASTDTVGGDISGTGQGMLYAGNMTDSPAIGITDPGFSSIAPDFQDNGDTTFRPSSTSPVSGAGADNYADIVNFDLQGLTRPEAGMDVGAHEVSGGTGSATRAPFINDDVRFLVGASFVDPEGTFVGNSGVDLLSVSSIAPLPNQAGSSALTVSSNVAWSATEDISWLSLTPASGTGNGGVSISVTENTSTDGRSGIISFTTSTLTRAVTITQLGYVAPTLVTAVSLSPEQASIAEDGTAVLTATITPSDATNQSVTYSSSDTDVATVNSDGEVTGISAGIAIITVTTDDGSFTDTSTITVNAISSTLNLALNKPVTGYEPQTANPLSHLTDDNPSNRWSADNFPQAATVDLEDLYILERSELVAHSDRAYQYTIEVATEATGPFTQIVDRTANTTPGLEDDPIEDFFTPVEGRYVRITVVGAAVYTGAWTSLSEFRVFGAPLPPPNGYVDWLASHPTLSETGPAEDWEGDGVPNILEYVLLGNPLVYDQSLPISGQKTATGYELTFDRSGDSANDTIQTLLYSSDLKNWSSVDFTSDIDSNVAVETNDSVDTVTIVIPDSEISNGKLFWKVHAELAP